MPHVARRPASRPQAAAAVFATVLAGALPALAGDVDVLPLGPPERAYRLGSGAPGDLVDCRADPPAVRPLDDVVRDLAAADVVLVGEHHTSLPAHELQWALLEALAATGRPLVLGMEFFESDDDPVLARWVGGRIDLDELIDGTGWYEAGSTPFEYYRPLLETARARRVPVRGVNVPREVIRTVSRQGYEALDEATRARIGELGVEDPRHRYAVNLMMGGLGASMPEAFEGMLAGQRTWDAAMARAILDAHAPGSTVVVVVGAGHVAHGLGIPARLASAAPDLVVRILVPVEAEAPEEDAAVHPGFEAAETASFSAGVADWVHVLPDARGAEAFPRLGVQVAPEKGRPRVKAVSEGGVAARSGLRAGDVLLAVGGAPVRDAAAARRALAAASWGQRLPLRIERDGVPRDVAVLVVAPADRPLDWLESEPASALLDTFDPLSSRAYRQAEDPGVALPHARLVTPREGSDQPVRVDVIVDGRLEQAWELDVAGRPVLGLLAEPAVDGAVRVEIERDAAGAVIAYRRLDARGHDVTPAPQGGAAGS